MLAWGLAPAITFSLTLSHVLTSILALRYDLSIARR